MNKIKTLTIILALILGINVYAATSSSQIAVNTTTPTQSTQTVQNYITVNPLDVVARPNFYLNKNIKIKAKFDKFSTLGLDYKPAMRSSENYISFLIQRPDVTDHNIPLSELKILTFPTLVAVSHNQVECPILNRGIFAIRAEINALKLSAVIIASG